MPVHGSNRDLPAGDHGSNHGVKLAQHGLNLVGSVRRHIDARRKRSALPAQHEDRHIRTRFDLPQRLRQLLHHRNVDDVQGHIP